MAALTEKEKITLAKEEEKMKKSMLATEQVLNISDLTLGENPVEIATAIANIYHEAMLLRTWKAIGNDGLAKIMGEVGKAITPARLKKEHYTGDIKCVRSAIRFSPNFIVGKTYHCENELLHCESHSGGDKIYNIPDWDDTLYDSFDDIAVDFRGRYIFEEVKEEN